MASCSFGGGCCPNRRRGKTKSYVVPAENGTAAAADEIKGGGAIVSTSI